MARTKNDGRGRLGGRAKGTPNKAHTDLKKWVADVLEGGRDKFVEYLKELEPQEYIKTFTALLNYVLPKQAPTNPESLIDKEKLMLQDLILTLPDEMVERVAERMIEIERETNKRKDKEL